MSSRRPPLDFEQAQNYLNITERHLRGLVYRKAIPYVKVGGLLRFMPNDLDAFVDSNRVEVGG